MDESIALVEFSKHDQRAGSKPFEYAHIEVWLKLWNPHRRPRVGRTDAVSRLRSCLVEECARLRRESRGRVLAWGRGAQGELGLGDLALHRVSPTLVPGLATRTVTCVAAGEARGGTRAMRRHFNMSRNSQEERIQVRPER